MDVIKAHVLATIVATQIVALLVDRSVPYFPIEVSRTAASGPTALCTMRVGFVLLLPVLVWQQQLTMPTLWLWAALVCIAVADDVRYWTVHMLGVAMMLPPLVVGAWSRSAMVPVLVGVSLYLFRLVIKTTVLIVYEVPVGEQRAQYKQGIQTWLRWLVAKVMERGMAVMYRGADACQHPSVVMPVFKICGVLQWVAFYCLSLAL